MQRLFDLPLLALATAMVSMLCLVCYVVTVSISEFNKVFNKIKMT